jgi:hypothetical protein
MLIFFTVRSRVVYRCVSARNRTFYSTWADSAYGDWCVDMQSLMIDTSSRVHVACVWLAYYVCDADPAEVRWWPALLVVVRRGGSRQVIR